MVGIPLPYHYDVQGNGVTIRTEFGGGATFHCRVNSYSGGWRPDDWAESFDWRARERELNRGHRTTVTRAIEGRSNRIHFTQAERRTSR